MRWYWRGFGASAADKLALEFWQARDYTSRLFGRVAQWQRS